MFGESSTVGGKQIIAALYMAQCREFRSLVSSLPSLSIEFNKFTGMEVDSLSDIVREYHKTNKILQILNNQILESIDEVVELIIKWMGNVSIPLCCR